jgi:hypothetical protein
MYGSPGCEAFGVKLYGRQNKSITQSA